MFPNTPSDSFWSSSVYAGDPNYAWFLYFYYGHVDYNYDKIHPGYVRLVRGGQSFNYFTLTLTKADNGAGTVTSSPVGINCGADCEEPYDIGTVVTLNATPVTGSTFAGWSGDADCSDGKVTMTASKTCTATFTLLPPKATLIAPKGTITDNTPTYQWNAVPTVTWYYLWVNDSKGTPIKQWYTAAQAGCAAGTGVCAVTPSQDVVNGAATWWIQTWNSSGYGPWSAGLGFTVNGSHPPKATLIVPTDTITDSTPTYTWNAVPTASWHYLWVNDSKGTPIKQWYTAEQLGCAAGTGVCAVTPSTPLNSTIKFFLVDILRFS